MIKNNIFITAEPSNAANTHPAATRIIRGISMVDQAVIPHDFQDVLKLNIFKQRRSSYKALNLCHVVFNSSLLRIRRNILLRKWKLSAPSSSGNRQCVSLPIIATAFEPVTVAPKFKTHSYAFLPMEESWLRSVDIYMQVLTLFPYFCQNFP